MAFQLKSSRLLILLVFFLTAACSLVFYSAVKVRDVGGTDLPTTEITINFLLPMRCNTLPEKIVITPELPTTTVHYTAYWSTGSTLILRIRQAGCPQGQLLRWRVDGVPTVIPLISKSAGGKYRPRVRLTLVAEDPVEGVPSLGPVPISFNTPVRPDGENIIPPAPGKLEPVQFWHGGKKYTDYSRWLYFPDKLLKSGSTHRIVFLPGLKSLAGAELGARKEFVFTTAEAPRVLKTVPPVDAKGVKLYRQIEFTTDRKMLSASVSVTDPGEDIDVPGRTIVKNDKVIFTPSGCFLPGKRYKVKLEGLSENREPLDPFEFFFSTVNLGNRFWVDVKLAEIHTVRIYRGATLVRHMPASGGKLASPTPTGYFVTQDRGFSFWSARFGEGATYWVRLYGQVLIHSVPRDHKWETKEEEHAKLGLPASHGCIRLDEKDARWFYENIPMGTLVIIHN